MTTVQRRIRRSRILCALYTAAAVFDTFLFADCLAAGKLLFTILSAVGAAGFATAAVLRAVMIRLLRRGVMS